MRPQRPCAAGPWPWTAPRRAARGRRGCQRRGWCAATWRSPACCTSSRSCACSGSLPTGPSPWAMRTTRTPSSRGPSAAARRGRFRSGWRGTWVATLPSRGTRLRSTGYSTAWTGRHPARCSARRRTRATTWPSCSSQPTASARSMSASATAAWPQAPASSTSTCGRRRRCGPCRGRSSACQRERAKAGGPLAPRCAQWSTSRRPAASR
mmetsp:Transcript_12551/g.39287  ORF Transcript_12551/g.39287 Transcript_12551/m.39287 type:complete len:209 (+) Transcript_12551:133-759(+)